MIILRFPVLIITKAYFYLQSIHSTAIFDPVPQQQHSKIYKALNPDKLWHESRREREMAKENDDSDDGENEVCLRYEY
jgi:hypothetical protein